MFENEVENYRQRVAELWMLLGQCVAKYQSIDDYVIALFLSAWAEEELPRANRIFRLFLGKQLETRLNLAEAAIVESSKSSPDMRAAWPELRKRISAAAAERGSYAHAVHVTYGGGIVVLTDPETGAFGEFIRQGPQMPELHKTTKAGVRRWDIEALTEELGSLSKLHGELIAYSLAVRAAHR